MGVFPDRWLRTSTPVKTTAVAAVLLQAQPRGSERKFHSPIGSGKRDSSTREEREKRIKRQAIHPTHIHKGVRPVVVMSLAFALVLVVIISHSYWRRLSRWSLS